MMTALSACRLTTPIIRTCVSSSSSSWANNDTLLRNSWITFQIVHGGTPPPPRKESDAAKDMAELLLLRLQVPARGVGGRHLERHAVRDFQPVSLEAHELARVVREQQDPVQAQLVQDLGADPVVALVRLEAQRLVGLHRVLALVLEL